MTIRITRLMWKDKYDTPRVERNPSIEIELKYVHYINFGFDDFWEQYLWLKYYGNKDDYPWFESGADKSTWKSYWILEVYNYVKYKIKYPSLWKKKTERKN